MYHTIKDFLNDWTYENESTMKVFRTLIDTSLGQKITPEGRSLGFLAWHIVLTLGEMGAKAGLNITAPPEDTVVPEHTADIVSAYEKAGASVAAEVKRTWTDAMLSELIDMYGEQWTRAAALASLVKHQIHHRSQMTVLMRQAGLKVPGIYGPSLEEWSQFGMKAPE